MSKPKVIAFYLPQYHPTPDNDKWWGKGFTEWTNVGKAKPLFRGHYQPKVPADLGYYDLRLPEVREAQAELAKEAGIYGFCYYHYWFGNGKEELELPFNEVLRLGKPNFPFMLCWANESWHKKFWNKDGIGSSKEMLIEQTYPGDQDIIDHFYHLLPAFKDSRYIKIEGKLAFMIYAPEDYPDIEKFTKKWQELASINGIPPFFFIIQARSTNKLKKSYESFFSEMKKKGIHGINIVRLYDASSIYNKKISNKIKGIIQRKIFKQPIRIDYRKLRKNLLQEFEKEEYVYPTIIPNWDHTPRSGKKGIVFENTHPEEFKIHIKEALEIIESKSDDQKIIFLKSWNEWGEGNYIEPDLKYGKEYLKAIRESIKFDE